MDRIVHRENLAHYRRLLVERAGRVDDVINVSGHPMSTAEVELALVVVASTTSVQDQEAGMMQVELDA